MPYLPTYWKRGFINIVIGLAGVYGILLHPPILNDFVGLLIGLIIINGLAWLEADK